MTVTAVVIGLWVLTSIRADEKEGLSERPLYEKSIEQMRSEALPDVSAPSSTWIRIRTVGYLQQLKDPPPGYGMYAYLLLTPPIDEIGKWGQLELLRAFLDIEYESVSARPPETKRSQLSFLLLTVSTPIAISDTVPSALERYDYARSERLLGHLMAPPRTGPYLVACLVPLDESRGCRSEGLISDLSGIPVTGMYALVRTWAYSLDDARKWNRDSVIRSAAELDDLKRHASPARFSATAVIGGAVQVGGED